MNGYHPIPEKFSISKATETQMYPTLWFKKKIGGHGICFTIDKNVFPNWPIVYMELLQNIAKFNLFLNHKFKRKTALSILTL